MRCAAVSLSALLFLAVPARAAVDSSQPTFNVQLFDPTPGANNFITVESGDVNSHLGLSAGLSLNYARNPLGITLLNPDGTKQNIGLVVKNRLDANLLLAFGLFDIADIGVALPFIYQNGFDKSKFDDSRLSIGNIKPKEFTQGDIRVVPKVRFLYLGNGLLSAAIVGTVIIPTAQKTPYASENNVVYAPSLAFSTRTSLLRAAFNIGYRYRDKTKFQTLKIDDEVFTKLAVGMNLNIGQGSPIELIGEVFGHTPSQNAFALHSKGTIRDFQRARTSLEADLGLRYPVTEHFMLSFGGGGGLLPGYGAPAPRVFAGVTYYNGQVGAADADQDGVPDNFDKCPDKKEDRDNFEDDDGCPDVDNDKDNVLDEDDQCPNEPEDKDGFQDEDGCPDPDNDNDGLLDADDKCPTEAEDKDGFQDEDGCPDLDNDGDGIADTVDKCPNEPEDKDGFQDADGCPDLDNDGDGLPDLNDLCPNFAEDKDGVADDDGCPEDNDGDGIPDELDKCPNEAEIYNGIEDEDGCPEKLKVKSLVKVTDEKIEISEKIFFKTNSAVIMSKSFKLLDQVVSVLKNYKGIKKVRIEGHTDSRGSKRHNTKLSQDRAESVMKYLTGHGIAQDRLEAVGYGPTKPIASNKTAKGREANRRVEFVIADMKPPGVDVSETQPKVDMDVEMPAPPPPSGGDTAAPGGAPSFEMDVGAPTDEKKDEAPKGKGKSGKKDKKADEPQIEFGF